MSHSALIVGAGISGLVAARRLRKKDWQVTLLEKSKGYGGRMASRRIGEATFDHGAQFMTVHTMFFRLLIEKLEDEGLIGRWSRGFLNGDRQLVIDGYQRYFAPQGMNSLGKHLGAELDVRLQQQASQLEQLPQGWRVTTSSGLQIDAESLVLTAPLPQSLDLLKGAQGTHFDPELLEKLKAIKYDPCIAVMAVLDGPSGIAEPGAIANTDPMSPIQWIADNQQKGLSSQPCVTILGTAHFSRQHWKLEREAAGEKLLEAAQPYLQAGVLEKQTHGWRFAQPKELWPEKSLLLNSSPPLLLAGDAFGDLNNPIEGAAVSGLTAAKALLKLYAEDGSSGAWIND